MKGKVKTHLALESGLIWLDSTHNPILIVRPHFEDPVFATPALLVPANQKANWRQTKKRFGKQQGPLNKGPFDMLQVWFS